MLQQLELIILKCQGDLDLNNKLAVQSMAGLEVHLEFNNLQYLKETLSQKSNKPRHNN